MGKRPSGSADPFGLRRTAIGLARILNSQGWLVKLDDLLTTFYKKVMPLVKLRLAPMLKQRLLSYIWDRVAGLLADEGINITLVRAANADDPPVILAAQRCHLLEALSAEEGFEDLLILYKACCQPS